MMVAALRRHWTATKCRQVCAGKFIPKPVDIDFLQDRRRQLPRGRPPFSAASDRQV
jgi:hypothetical protein